MPPYGPKFSQFHAVFRKICQFRMLASPLDDWLPLLRGILDPPLHRESNLMFTSRAASLSTNYVKSSHWTPPKNLPLLLTVDLQLLKLLSAELSALSASSFSSITFSPTPQLTRPPPVEELITRMHSSTKYTARFDGRHYIPVSLRAISVPFH